MRQDAAPWTIGDYIMDEAGNRRRVVGVGHLQQHADMQGRMVQLLVEGTEGSVMRAFIRSRVGCYGSRNAEAPPFWHGGKQSRHRLETTQGHC